jgi:predicted dehydrogenase
MVSIALEAPLDSSEAGSPAPNIRVALVGFGYWGPNLARCVAGSAATELAVICDKSAGRAEVARTMFPRVPIEGDLTAVLRDPAIDAVILATPTATHARLGCMALEHGKHVLVEKPLADTSTAASTMAAAAERRGLVLMVDHTYLFSPGFAAVRRLIVERELGPIRYYHSTRSNCFGPGHETNVVWDLATHDLSLLDALMGSPPASIQATGLRTADGDPDAHVQLILTWPDRALASVLVSWIAPVKVRQILIGFDRHTIAWDDLVAGGSVQLFDRGLEPLLDPADRRLPHMVSESIPVPASEPLATAIEHFTECIARGSSPRSNAAAGLRVVRLLEMADLSLAQRGGSTAVEIAMEAG